MVPQQQNNPTREETNARTERRREVGDGVDRHQRSKRADVQTVRCVIARIASYGAKV